MDRLARAGRPASRSSGTKAIAALGEPGRDTGVGPHRLEAARLGQGLAIGDRIFGPQPNRLDGVLHRLVDRAAAGIAAGKIREGHAITVDGAVDETDIAGHSDSIRPPAHSASAMASRRASRMPISASAATVFTT